MSPALTIHTAEQDQPGPMLRIEPADVPVVVPCRQGSLPAGTTDCSRPNSGRRISWRRATESCGGLSGTGSLAAIPLLRFKALSGDRSEEVMAECFTSLLALDLEHSLPFVARFLHHGNEIVQGEAVLALAERAGASL